MIYLDNNATTIMAAESKKEMIKWCNMGNPSADYQSARDTRLMMDNFRAYIGKLSAMSVCNKEMRDEQSTIKSCNNGAAKYQVIFCSGASEANATVINNTISAYKCPHIIYSVLEHRSIIDCILHHVKLGNCTADIIPATLLGTITVQNVKKVIKSNTKLVCVMHANNELGTINDVHEIGKLAHSVGAHMHADTVQTYGKFPIAPSGLIDSFCISFHKIGGPPGCGVLCIKQLVSPLIFGSQNSHYRGGTENVPGIAASFVAMQLAFVSREKKNMLCLQRGQYIVSELVKNLPTMYYTEYNPETIGSKITIVFLSCSPRTLPGTVLLSVVSTRSTICNVEIKKKLANAGIIISVGSACNTANSKSSHVLYGIGADEYIRRGALRISVGDSNTDADVRIFAQKFINIVKSL